MNDKPPLRKERVEAREEAILNAAHSVFSEHGFKGARMAEIAERAEVAEGTLYLYFRNKDALLGGVIGRFYADLTASALSGVQQYDDTVERLRFLGTHHMEQCLAEWRILELMVGQYRELAEYEDRGYAALNRTYVAVFDSVIGEAIARGEIRSDISLSVLRDLFYGTLEYVCRTSMLHEGPRKPAQAVDELIRIFQTGVLQAVSNAEKTTPLAAVARRLERVASRMEASLSADTRTGRKS